MIEQVHKQILSEVNRISRNDTIFVIGAAAFNFIAMVICWNLASTNYRPMSKNLDEMIIFSILMLAVSSFTIVSLKTLTSSEKMCVEYQCALSRIYEDHDVSKYMPKNVERYSMRSNFLRKIFVLMSGLIAMSIPLVAELL